MIQITFLPSAVVSSKGTPIWHENSVVFTSDCCLKLNVLSSTAATVTKGLDWFPNFLEKWYKWILRQWCKSYLEYFRKLEQFHLPNYIAYSQGRHKRVKVFTFCHLPFSKYIRIDVTCHTCLMRCENEIAVIIQNG